MLIETIPAAFEMEEILYELRDHASGLNAGRWDYLFSVIKNFRDAGPEFVLPDRGAVTMTAPMMRAYTELLVATCHRRGAFAIGGMAAFIPSRRDAGGQRAGAAPRCARTRTREAGDGFDGSWVAHPDLVAGLPGGVRRRAGRPAQPARPAARRRAASPPTQLLDVAGVAGRRSPRPGCAANVEVALRYLAAWLGGNGAVGIHNLMEDAATAEISPVAGVAVGAQPASCWTPASRSPRELVRGSIAEEVAGIRPSWATPRDARSSGARLFEQVALADDFADFLTLPAYELVD